MSSFLQVCNNSHRLDESDMVLHLRSDFEAVTVPLQVKLPKVYIIGTSISAARRMISVLGQQDQNPTLQSKSVQPAEIALDGIRWCNLLAAPAATPKLATAALTLSLASQKRGFAETWGPVKLASKWIEVMICPCFAIIWSRACPYLLSSYSILLDLSAPE